MRINKLATILLCMIGMSFLSACSESQYAAHVAKQINLPQDSPSKSIGTFKVGNSYKIQGDRYYPAETYNHTETGTASWYGPGFDGKKTANGEVFDKNELTAAHRTLQMPSIIKVTNLENGRSAILRVNDRGPFAHERILDVSERAASILGFKHKGVAKVRIEVVADASKEVASIAKSGASTRGHEIAYNDPEHFEGDHGGYKGLQIPVSRPQSVPQIAVKPVVINDEVQIASVPSVQSEALGGNVVTQTNNVQSYNPMLNQQIVPTGRLFVQAGSFSQEANALKFSNSLAKFGPSRVYMTKVNNQPFFRVRLGPYNNSAQAQQVIASLSQSGNNNAVIITE